MLRLPNGRLCREGVVDISLRAMRIVSPVIRRCQLKIMFQAKREIRLSVENELVPHGFDKEMFFH